MDKENINSNIVIMTMCGPYFSYPVKDMVSQVPSSPKVSRNSISALAVVYIYKHPKQWQGLKTSCQ